MSIKPKSITFKHANADATVDLFLDQIFGVMELKENRCVGIIGPGNAVVPVTGTKDEVTKRIKEAKASTEERREETNE